MVDMSCESWSERMPWLLNGTEARETLESFRSHLAECATCQTAWDATLLTWRSMQPHPPTELINALALNDPIESDVQMWLDAHLSTCTTCRDELSSARLGARRFRTFRVPWRQGIALAAALIVGIAIGSWFSVDDMIDIQAIDLMSAETRAVEPQQVSVSRRAKRVLVILYPQHEAERWDAIIHMGDQTFAFSQLQRLDDGSISMTLDAGRIRPGTYPIQLRSGNVREVIQVAWHLQEP